MTKIFKVPFATQGDRTSIPNEVQSDGAVSYTQGYGYDYERDQVSDPAAKDIEREKMNGIFHDITEAVGEIQNYGFPKWAEEGKPYPIRAIVYHKNKVWQSKVENNEIEPVAGAQWAELKADLTAGDINVYNKTESDKRYQPLGNYQVAGYSYSKSESDTNYQPKGNYAPAANYAMKGDSYTKAEGDGRYQPKGSYQPAGNYAVKGESYTKAEEDGRFQPKGSYQAAGYSYSKSESDGIYQPKGNYQPTGNYALKGESYTKAEGDGRYQPKGNYQPTGNYALKGDSYTKSETYSRTEVDSKIGAKGEKNTASKAANGWWKCADTGMIYQWGTVTRTGDNTTVTFPTPFPNACVNVNLTLYAVNGWSNGNVRAHSLSKVSFVYWAADVERSSYWFAIGY